MGSALPNSQLHRSSDQLLATGSGNHESYSRRGELSFLCYVLELSDLLFGERWVERKLLVSNGLLRRFRETRVLSSQREIETAAMI